jgi:hypothetical protein
MQTYMVRNDQALVDNTTEHAELRRTLAELREAWGDFDHQRRWMMSVAVITIILTVAINALVTILARAP